MPSQTPATPANRALLKSARLFHLYSGVFLAPALLFFAVTGGLQTFSLHETTQGSNYKPPAILVKLGQLHKKQTLIVPNRKPPIPEAKLNSKPELQPTPAIAPPSQHKLNLSHLGDHTNQQKHDRVEQADQPDPVTTVTPPNTTAAVTSPSLPAAAPPARKPNLLPMKIFFVITSLGLFLSTLTGLFMTYKYTRSAAAITATLAAGIAIPLILLYLQ